MKEAPYDELLAGGYIQEANRLFFHPLGLELCVTDGDRVRGRMFIKDFRDAPIDGQVQFDAEYLETMAARYRADYIAAEMRSPQAIRAVEDD